MTAASGFANCACPCIQQALNDVAGKNAQALRRDKVGMISFLLSPENVSGIEKIRLDPGTGKQKCVTLNWYHKACESTIQDLSDDCTTGVESEPLCEDINITNSFETKNMVFDEDNMRRICEPNGATDAIWIANIINGQINSMLTYWDKLVLTAISANLGAFMDGSAIKAIQLYNTVNNDAVGPRTRALSNIQDELDQAGFLGMPNIIGAGETNKWVDSIGYGTANAAGQDVAKMKEGFNFFYDRFLEGVFGINEFLVLVPGVSQLLTWNRYVGTYAKVSNTFEHGTIVDPLTGIKFDLKMHYDDCIDTYFIKLQQNWELFVVPDEGDSTCQDTYGVNGIYNYQGCDDIIECGADYSWSER